MAPKRGSSSASGLGEGNAEEKAKAKAVAKEEKRVEKNLKAKDKRADDKLNLETCAALKKARLEDAVLPNDIAHAKAKGKGSDGKGKDDIDLLSLHALYTLDRFADSPTESEQALEALAEVASDDLLNPQGIRPAWFDTV